MSTNITSCLFTGYLHYFPSLHFFKNVFLPSIRTTTALVNLKLAIVFFFTAIEETAIRETSVELRVTAPKTSVEFKHFEHMQFYQPYFCHDTVTNVFTLLPFF